MHRRGPWYRCYQEGLEVKTNRWREMCKEGDMENERCAVSEEGRDTGKKES